MWGMWEAFNFPHPHQMRTRRRRQKPARKSRTFRRPPFQRGGAEVTGTILDQASTQVLRITMPPGAALVTDQNTMAYMTGQLQTSVQMGGQQKAQEGAGFLNALKRTFSGESFFVNQVTNPSNETAEITLAPSIPSAITEIALEPEEEWKMYPGCLLAATSNVSVSGSLNVFQNFRSSFVTGSAMYTTVKATGGPGRAWICGFGGIEKRDITTSNTPFILNNGTFLAMPAKYWDSHVDVGTAGGILNAFLTDIGFVMKIQNRRGAPSVTIPLYMQSLNIRNFQQMIKTIAATEAKRAKEQKPFFSFSSQATPMDINSTNASAEQDPENNPTI